MNKKEAEKFAKKLQNKLGFGWQIDIWENSDWHYRVFRDNISVHASHSAFGPITYNTYISDKKGSDGANYEWHVKNQDIDPIKSIQKAIIGFKNYLEKMKICDNWINEATSNLTK